MALTRNEELNTTTYRVETNLVADIYLSLCAARSYRLAPVRLDAHGLTLWSQHDEIKIRKKICRIIFSLCLQPHLSAIIFLKKQFSKKCFIGIISLEIHAPVAQVDRAVVS